MLYYDNVEAEIAQFRLKVALDPLKASSSLPKLQLLLLLIRCAARFLTDVASMSGVRALHLLD